MIITFLACVDEKNHDFHCDREENQWQKGQQDKRNDGLGDNSGNSKCSRTDRGDEDLKIWKKW